MAALGAALYASPTVSIAPGGRYPRVLCRVPEIGDSVVLTFDDGPHPEATPAILSGLDELDLRATFFVVGEQAVRHPGVVSKIADAGHEVALHGYRHLPHALMAPAAVTRDLARGKDVLENILGHPVRAVRAPFGAASLATLAFAVRRDLVLAGWSRWGWDWTRRSTPTSIAHSLTSGVGAGDILLLHDSDAYSAAGTWRRTVEALPIIASALAERGLVARPLPAP